jgi:hypothetical protein
VVASTFDVNKKAFRLLKEERSALRNLPLLFEPTLSALQRAFAYAVTAKT